MKLSPQNIALFREALYAQSFATISYLCAQVTFRKIPISTFTCEKGAGCCRWCTSMILDSAALVLGVESRELGPLLAGQDVTLHTAVAVLRVVQERLLKKAHVLERHDAEVSAPLGWSEKQ